jgi:putative restriction endonuclease
VQAALAAPSVHAIAEHRYGKPILVQRRLGQGAFRLLVTDAYQRRCAVIGAPDELIRIASTRAP